MINKQFIENKLKEITKIKEQLVANLNALSGAEKAYREMLNACENEKVKNKKVKNEEVKPDE